MELVLLGLVQAGIAARCLASAFALRRRTLLSQMMQPISLLGALFVFQAVLSLSSGLGVFSASADAEAAQTVLLVPTALLLGILVQRLTGHRELRTLLCCYAAALFAIVALLSARLLDVQFLSYFYITVLFLHLEFFPQPELSRAGYFGLMFAGPITLLTVSSLTHRPLLAALAHLPLFLSFQMLDRAIPSSRVTVLREPLVHFSMQRAARFLGFLTTFYLFAGLAVIGLHEVGHALAASSSGCEHSKAVIYDLRDSPHTEISCERGYNDHLLTLGGFAATTLVGALLLLLGTGLSEPLGLFVVGFGFLISFSDLMELTAGVTLLTLLHLVSLGLLSLSIVQTTVQYRSGTADVEEHVSLTWGQDAR
ncbi:hypothetical protein J4439_01955 [Candidatus Woesearchaeota archaeon]|nr:hypothetical protein [Candidatus Woesearchaeota archaeon]